MKICIVYSSPKLGDVILQLPFIKLISETFKKKVVLCINGHLNIKSILINQDYIEDIIENRFGRKQYFFQDLLKLYKNLKNYKFDRIYIFEKTKMALIASIFAGIKKRYAYGIGVEKIFLSNFTNCLAKEHLKYNYTEQSKIFMKKLGFNDANFNQNFLKVSKNECQALLNRFNQYKKPWVALGIDSNETNRIWPMENFAKLVDRLIDDKKVSFFFVLNQNRDSDNIDYFKDLQNFSKNKDKLLDCKIFDRNEIIKILSISDYFIGIDSGPSCISASMSKKTFCIFGATDKNLPQFTSMIKIISDHYNNDREIGKLRCGDNFDQTNWEAKTITVQKVYESIKKEIN